MKFYNKEKLFVFIAFKGFIPNHIILTQEKNDKE